MRVLNGLVALSVCLLLSAMSVGVSGCAYCQERPWVCVGGGLLIVGGVVLIAANDPPDLPSPSDLRLKRDVAYYGTLANGVRTYSFRYWNSSHTFVGVIAQDLLEDPRFRQAVQTGAGGYYYVDLRALKLGFVGPKDVFDEAGRRAVDAAVAAADG